MNVVKFPGLNLEFNFNKIFFTIGNIEIYKYSVCIVLGMITGLIIARLNKNKFEIKYDDLLEAFIFIIIPAIIGARLYYIIFNIEKYKSIIDILNIRDGGLAIYGGLLVGSVSIYIFCKIKKINFLDFLDYIVPSVVIAQGIGRLGNFFNVEAFGIKTTCIFRMGIINNNIYSEVHPTFLYESFFDILICIFLLIMQRKRKFKGEILAYYFLSYSFIRFFIERLRQDSLYFMNFRVSQVLSFILFISTIIFYFVEKCKTKNGQNTDN